MFQNAYQSGPSLEIFDPKISKEKDKNYANLVKLANHNLIKKVYDKEMKGYIYELDSGVNSKIIFPRDEKSDLALLQQYVVFQLFLPQFQAFGIDLVITDTSKTKRRVNLTTAVNRIDSNFFHVKIPIEIIKRGVWINLAIDVLSFMEAFKGQTFRSLDGIIISAVCKLRKVFTLRYPPYIFKTDPSSPELRDLPNAQEIPKNLNYPSGVPYMNQILNYDMIKLLNEPNNDPIRLLPLKNQKPNTSSTPSKNTKPHPKLQTPTKEATPIFPDQEFEEDYKENKQNLPLEAPEEEIKAEDSFQPMGKAALTNKKNPWTVITSNKVLPKTKPLPKDPIPAPKPTKRLDLQALKKKGKNVKEKPGVKTLDIEKDRESSPDYYEKSSKFNTVTDPRTFAPENLMLNKWNNGEEVSESHIEIEENIKEIESMRGSKRPIKEKLPVSSVFKSTEKKDFLGDSMRSPLKRDFIEENRGEKQGDVNIKGNFYEQELDKMIKEDIRPYSPPFNGGSNKSGDGEIKKSKSPLEGIKKGEENMLEVVFDPVLNCYYDPKTNSYYDLIN